MAEAGYAHWLQLDPALPVGVVEWTHAARHSSRLPASVQEKNHQTRQDVRGPCHLGELITNLTSFSGRDHISV